MNASAKVRARYRAREAMAKANEKRYRQERANVDDATTIRAVMHRVGAVDAWERTRIDQVAEHVRADAINRRARHFADLQAAVDRMRKRGQTMAAIATLVDVDVREIRAALRRGRTGDAAGPRGTVSTSDLVPLTDTVERRADDGDGAGAYDPTRCIRCDAVMLDADDARRGRRRLYCSDTCRRDASAARMAAERYGSPIRVVEVPRAGSSAEPAGPDAVSPLDVAALTVQSDEALHSLLAQLTEQARLKKLDRATLSAARELSKAVHPHRSW